jgi:hypothetical protein
VFADDVQWEGSEDDRVPGGGKFKGRDDVLGARLLTDTAVLLRALDG